MPDTADLIWIEVAMEVYKRSRNWLDAQVKAGKLSYATIPGDRKLYLLRSELDALLRPEIHRNIEESDSGQTA